MKVIDSLKKEVEKIMNNDPAHDFEHVMRVFKNAENICKKEKAIGNEKKEYSFLYKLQCSKL